MVRNFAVRSRRKGWEQQASRYGFLRYVAFLTGGQPERTQS